MRREIGSFYEYEDLYQTWFSGERLISHSLLSMIGVQNQTVFANSLKIEGRGIFVQDAQPSLKLWRI